MEKIDDLIDCPYLRTDDAGLDCKDFINGHCMHRCLNKMGAHMLENDQFAMSWDFNLNDITCLVSSIKPIGMFGESVFFCNERWGTEQTDDSIAAGVIDDMCVDQRYPANIETHTTIKLTNWDDEVFYDELKVIFEDEEKIRRALLAKLLKNYPGGLAMLKELFK